MKRWDERNNKLVAVGPPLLLASLHKAEMKEIPARVRQLSSQILRTVSRLFAGEYGKSKRWCLRSEVDRNITRRLPPDRAKKLTRAAEQVDEGSQRSVRPARPQNVQGRKTSRDSKRARTAKHALRRPDTAEHSAHFISLPDRSTS